MSDQHTHDLETIGRLRGEIAGLQAERDQLLRAILVDGDNKKSRCPCGHNAMLSYLMDGVPGCVACDRDAALSQRDRAVAAWDRASDRVIELEELLRLKGD